MLINISGNVVLTNISGNVVLTTVSGNIVNISGQASVSGNMVSISGQPIRNSGQMVSVSGIVAAKVSGETITISNTGFLTTTLSGNMVSISGQPVVASVTTNISGQVVQISGQTVVASVTTNISGQTVVSEVSGQALRVSGSMVAISGQPVLISGQTVVASVTTNISGQVVLISGQTVVASVTTNISGQTVVAEVSGQLVLTSVSGQMAAISGQAVQISGQTLNVSTSGQVAYLVSGNNPVQISGEAVRISGQTLAVSGSIALNAGTIVLTTVSGNVVNISGNVVATSISGNIVNVSGQVASVSVSGNMVTVSGQPASISGQTVLANVSGNFSTSGNFMIIGETTTTDTANITTAGDLAGGTLSLTTVSYMQAWEDTSAQFKRIRVTASGAQGISGAVHKLIVAFSGDPVSFPFVKTYTFTTQDTSGLGPVPASGANMFTMHYVSGTPTIKLKALYMVNVDTTIVSGMILRMDLNRTTTAPTGGTALSAVENDPSDTGSGVAMVIMMKPTNLVSGRRMFPYVTTTTGISGGVFSSGAGVMYNNQCHNSGYKHDTTVS